MDRSNMPSPFDLGQLNYKLISEASLEIRDGWLAQFRGQAWISRAIQYGTGGPHSHSAMLRSTGANVDVLEMVEGAGGRVVPLNARVAECPGQVDVFSPDVEKWPEFDGYGAVEYMRVLTGAKYGYHGLLEMGLRRCPLVWRLFPFSTSDDHGHESKGDTVRSSRPPFCSHAVCSALRIGGHVDPVPRKPDYLVCPNDLTWSLFFRYEFTLIPVVYERLSRWVGERIDAQMLASDYRW